MHHTVVAPRYQYYMGCQCCTLHSPLLSGQGVTPQSAPVLLSLIKHSVRQSGRLWWSRSQSHLVSPSVGQCQPVSSFTNWEDHQGAATRGGCSNGMIWIPPFNPSWPATHKLFHNWIELLFNSSAGAGGNLTASDTEEPEGTSCTFFLSGLGTSWQTF